MKKTLLITIIALLFSCSKEEKNSGTDFCFLGKCHKSDMSSLLRNAPNDTQISLSTNDKKYQVRLDKNSKGLFATVTNEGKVYYSQYNVTNPDPRKTTVLKPKINANFVYKDGKVTVSDIMYVYDPNKVNDSTKIELKLNFTTK